MSKEDEKLWEDLRNLRYFKTTKLQSTLHSSPTNTTSHFLDEEVISPIYALFTARLEESYKQGRYDALEGHARTVQAREKAVAEEIKRELIKINPVDEMLGGLILTPKQWQNFWQRRGIR